MNLSLEEEWDFQAAEKCHICEKPFSDINDLKVRYHCHLTGLYRSAAHNSCNLNYRNSFNIPVVMHNLSGYDIHFLITDLANEIDGSTKVISQNLEKYIAVIKYVEGTRVRLTFIDSFRFMASSLQTLASNLENDKKHILKRHFQSIDDFNLLTEKGVFPYGHVTDESKLEECKLPDESGFFNEMNESDISEEDYARAVKVWNHFCIKTLGEYSDLYLKTDVIALADIFENFRDTMMKSHCLDPANYFSLPGYSWDAMLKYTGVELELLTDIDHLMFYERGIRGGLVQCSNRYSKANNWRTPDYNPAEPIKHILYLDFNNLYGYAQSKHLPVGGFKWLDEINGVDKADIGNTHIQSLPDETEYGYVFEVNLSFPPEIHDIQKDLPMCPENAIPPGSKHPKLMATLYVRKRYIIHFQNLKQCLRHGLILDKVHRILQFRQSPFLKSYIELNTNLRKSAVSTFEKNLYKLMNNAVFGKSMENVRKRSDVHLKSDWDGPFNIEALIAKPNFHRMVSFNRDLVAIELSKLIINFDKPIYLGFTILELAKHHVYDFHYDYILPKFGEKAKLLYTDTDSLVYEFTHPNIYDCIREDIQKFDTSDYPENNPLGVPRNMENKKKIGIIKDESNGKCILRWAALRPKMYAFEELEMETDEGGGGGVAKTNVVKRAKGVRNHVVDKKITIDDYENCLINNEMLTCVQSGFRSKLHKVYSVKEQKISLSPHDDKRYLMKNTTDTLPFGHKDIINTD